MIEFNDVSIGYSNLLLRIDFNQLELHQAYALVGSNGSGKSTFLKTLAGLVPPFSGEIKVATQQLNQLSTIQKAKEIAFVPSRFPTIGQMTVSDFVGLGRTPYLNAFGRLQSSDKEIVDHAIEVLKIEKLKSKFTHEISDGERQLCAIAQAICQTTSVILLDEPTNFLDYKNRGMIVERLHELAKQFSKSIIYSSHDLDVVVAQDAQIIYANPAKQLLGLRGTISSKNELIELMENVN